MSAVGLQQELLEAAVTALPADELSAVREAAVASFAANGFPTTKHEDWKYTNLSAVAALSNTWLQNKAAEPGAQAIAVDTAVTGQIDAHWITIKNGIVDPASLRKLDSLTESGVTFARLAEDVDKKSIAVDDPLSAFNAALLRDGLRIRVANDSALDKPVGLLLIDDGSVAVTQARILIEVGENAKLRVVECSQSAGGDQQFANSVTQAVLCDNAALDFVRLQQRGKEHLSVNRFSARLERDAVLNYNNFDFGGELARNDIVADIVAAGASVDLRGLYLASAFSTAGPAACLTARQLCMPVQTARMQTSRITTCCFPRKRKSTPNRNSRFMPTMSSAVTERPWASSTNLRFSICAPGGWTRMRRRKH
jgi:Fe-S cluster assembly protein SufD